MAELVVNVFMFFVKLSKAMDFPGVSCTGVVVVVNEASYDGQSTSLSRCSQDEVVDEGFWRKRQWGCLFSKRLVFVVEEFVWEFSFGIDTEWNHLHNPLE